MSTNQTMKMSKLANNPKPAIAFTAVTYLLLGFLERLPGTYIPALAYFFALGILALYLMPKVIGLPKGRKSFQEYCRDIRLIPLTPLGRNIVIGITLAILTLSGILLSSLLTGHFVLDWSTIPGLRWIKGLTRGIWEEVFFRGIILVLFMRMYPQRKSLVLSSLLFAVIHLKSFALDLHMVVDLISIFFMGLLFAYVVLKTGSLLPAIIFHYFHDIFVNLVQNTPGADQVVSEGLLYIFLWVALVIGGLFTRYIVEHWSAGGSKVMVTQA